MDGTTLDNRMTPEKLAGFPPCDLESRSEPGRRPPPDDETGPKEIIDKIFCGGDVSRSSYYFKTFLYF
ncbi:hypothetical protein GFC29_1815 [Anoxybacillus sp. B7M1]|jgi:hypothetical protein|nr:hypothetical protein GFC28_3618 [Anoxybacillus sp. B2M1]ANB66013.1 hypothetical protein GFC29_1815 [Anoxybacillus sp. B7M1]